MTQPDRRLDALGEAVAGVLDRAADPAVVPTARRRLLARPGTRRAPRRGGVVAAAVAAAACVVALILWQDSGPAATTFVVGASQQNGAVGDWVAAEQGRSLAVRFSEGSGLTLEPGTRIRVTDTSPDGAGLLIERGTVHARIPRVGADTRWLVRAGPFSVRVVGTDFDTSWEPSNETLMVAVREGQVIVNGPLVPQDRRVVAGERLVVVVRQQRMVLSSLSDDAEPTAPPPSSAAQDTADEAPGDEEPSPAAADAAPQQPGDETEDPSASAPSWQELAKEGKHGEAWAAVERAGFERQLASASGAELMTLADVARFAGQSGRARQALLAARKRGARGHSAFLLGRVAADHLGNSGEAVRWFETYLQEQPSGALAEQALGRILEIQSRGAPDRARGTAQRYLDRYPKGAYAALARSVLQP